MRPCACDIPFYDWNASQFATSRAAGVQSRCCTRYGCASVRDLAAINDVHAEVDLALLARDAHLYNEDGILFLPAEQPRILRCVPERVELFQPKWAPVEVAVLLRIDLGDALTVPEFLLEDPPTQAIG